jgi:hypothetical protein
VPAFALDSLPPSLKRLRIICEVLPLNPPLTRVTDNWDALDDSVGGGLNPQTPTPGD